MITIRQGKLSDANLIADFQVVLAWESEKLRLDRAAVIKGVRAVFKDKSKGKYYIAELDGKPAGVLLTIPEWSDWRNSTVIWIHSLYVKPDARGKGVFRYMFEFLKEKTKKSQQFFGLRLYVDKNNRSAQAVYKKVGMTKDHYLLYQWMK
jgi:GNAT superfamily N-acetyltransferase